MPGMWACMHACWHASLAIKRAYSCTLLQVDPHASVRKWLAEFIGAAADAQRSAAVLRSAAHALGGLVADDAAAVVREAARASHPVLQLGLALHALHPVSRIKRSGSRRRAQSDASQFVAAACVWRGAQGGGGLAPFWVWLISCDVLCVLKVGQPSCSHCTLSPGTRQFLFP